MALTLAIPQFALAQTTATKPSAVAPVAVAQPLKAIYLEGYVPTPQSTTKRVYMVINNGVIETLSDEQLTADQIPAGAIKITEKSAGAKLLLSPGFIDMHNHLDHAVIPLWKGAEGQFHNRFAWRDNDDYEKNVRGQVTTIKAGAKSFGIESNFCKIIQYAEMKALLGGVTTIQGIGGTGNNACAFGHLIRNVENKADFDVTTDARVSFEVINPVHGLMMQNHLLPIMKSTGADIDEAYSQVPQDVKDSEPFSKRFKPTELTNLVEIFSKLKGLRETFQNMVTVNPEGNGKNRAYITHLAEGKSADPFSKSEFKMAQAMGFAQPGMVMIHGIGLDADDWIEAKKTDVNLVWSPFSNLLLYGETTDVASAKKAGINISLGSDWAPSGSKTLLDEVKIAKRYLNASGQGMIFSDKDFHDMLTINAANALKLEKKIGLIEAGYLADIVAVPLGSAKENPYSTIVNSDSSNIKLVIIGGKLVIGSKKLVQVGDKVEPILAQQTPACAKLKGQVVINLGFSLQGTIATLTPLVHVMDGHITCADKLYQSKINQLFDTQFNPANRGQIDLALDAERFENLNFGLTDLLSNRQPVK